MKTIRAFIFAILHMALVFAAIAWLLDSGAQAMGYRWQWHRVPEFIAYSDEGQWWPGELLSGLWVTVKIAVVSLCFTLIIALCAALLRRSRSIVGRMFALSYIELIRNTPLLVQIYLVYFAFGPMLGLARWTAAILVLALYQGAYSAEIIRAGLNSIDRGQFEAAHSLGLSPWRCYRHVVLPQVVQRTLPPLTNEVVSLIKNSSIVSVMAIFDLTTEGRNIVSDTAMSFEIWFTVAAIYLLLTLSLSALSAWFEHRLGAAWRRH